MTPRSLLALVAPLALVACDAPRTQIVVLMETDMTQGPGGALTHVRVTVRSAAEGTVRHRVTYPLRDPRQGERAFALPGTLGVVARDDDGSRSVEVDVDAIHDPDGDGTARTPMFTYAAVAPFAAERTLLLRVFLADRCRAEASRCGADETCGADRCVPRRVSGLPAVPPDFRPDASVGSDVPASRDATADLDVPDVPVAADVPPSDAACPVGLTRCGAACVDTRTSAAHCGACDARCAAGSGAVATCAAGRCDGACAQGLGDCDGDAANGCEADLARDPRHCGRCGASCAAAGATSTCAAGACNATCSAGFGDCDGMIGNGCEASLATPAHCGACGSACALPNTATQACAAGACAVGACPAGRADCDRQAANGCEADVQNDGANCGACGRLCPAGQFCSGGACSTRCATGLQACGSLCADLRTNPMHCGACGGACPARPGGSATCAAGRCGTVCNAGFADCDGDPADGCEVALNAVANCGACRRSCAVPHAAATCAMGSCAFTCEAGFGDCDGVPATGCETDLRAAATSCGACGAACALPHATARCAAGRCAVAACAAGWGDCDGNPANGCEVDLRNTASSCGACGRACSLANATAACAMGACALDACRPGYANCNGAAADGCEVTLGTDDHCGACGAQCRAPAMCSGRACVTACPAGTTHCGGGCVDTRTAVARCGRCGNACGGAPHATPRCEAGACGIACEAGWVDCDGMLANGCELQVGEECGGPDRCVTGVTSCMGGRRACVTTPVACGRPCGGGGRCDGAGACVRDDPVCGDDGGPAPDIGADAAVDAPPPDVAPDVPDDVAPPPDAADVPADPDAA